MASLVSGEASAHAHLHLDPSLQIPVKNKCGDCLPGGGLLFKLFCCGVCFRSNCCNTTIEVDDHPIYCHEDGRCEIFDASKTINIDESMRLSASRVKALVEREKRLSKIVAETGVNLDEKVEKGRPITIRELKRINTI